MINENKKENLDEIKKRLFGDLEVNIIEDSENPEKVTFERVMRKFEKANLYVKYNLKENIINQIFQYHLHELIFFVS